MVIRRGSVCAHYKGLFLLALFLALGFCAWARPLGGSLTVSLRSSFVPAFSLATKTVLKLTAEISGIGLAQTWLLTNEGLRNFSVVADWSVWVWNVDMGVGFLAFIPRMDYFKLTADTMFAGTYIENTFLLEYEAVSRTYGFGLEVIVERDLTREVTLRMTNRFGLEESIVEEMGWQFGSGYDIIPRPNPASLVYSTTELELSGISLCDSELTLKGKFDKESGFESLGFLWEFKPGFCCVEFKVEGELNLHGKSFALRPVFRGNGTGCVEIYVKATPPDGPDVTGLSLYGIGLKCRLGGFVIAVKEAFHGVLYQRKGPFTDLDLRAWDYVVEPDRDEMFYYLSTRYTQIWTIEYQDVEYRFAVDFYFSDLGALFDLYLITVDARFLKCDPLNWRLGASLGVAGSPELLFEFSLAF